MRAWGEMFLSETERVAAIHLVGQFLMRLAAVGAGCLPPAAAAAPRQRGRLRPQSLAPKAQQQVLTRTSQTLQPVVIRQQMASGAEVYATLMEWVTRAQSASQRLVRWS